MALGKARLKLYQIEFETTPISIEALCGKYSLTTSDLAGYTKWKKKEHSLSTQTTEALSKKIAEAQAKPAEEPLEDSLPKFDLAPEEEDLAPDLKVAEAPTLIAENIPEATDVTVVPDDIESGDYRPIPKEPKTPQQLLVDIAKFKESAVQHCLNFMVNDAQMAETKEFKEVVSIIDTLEKSLVPKVPEGPSTQVTVQVMVQNLMGGQPDDC